MKLCLKDAFSSVSFQKTYTYRFAEDELSSLPCTLVSDAVDVKVTVNAVNGNVTCDMLIEADFKTTCSRCADEFIYRFCSETSKPVLLDDGICDKDAVFLDNSYCFDVNEEVYARIYFEFPMAPLCRDDCKGLCSVCGCNLNASSCSCDTRTVDPRLAVLKNLFDK